MHSFEMLTRITGLPLWADRCEEIALNSFPASMTPDQKALHYITAVNQVQLDRNNKSPGIQNGGTMFSYSPGEVYRCCQHNVAHGWPYYAEEMWLATADNGLCASLYAPSDVTAKVGQGAEVSIHEETDYPFRDTIELKCRRATREVSALFAGAAMVRRGEREGQRRGDRRQGPAPVLHRPGSDLERRRPRDAATPDADCRASLAEEPGRRFRELRPAEFLAGHPRAVGKVRRHEGEVARMGGLSRVGVELRPGVGCPGSGQVAEIVRQPGDVPLQPFTPDAAPLALKAKARKIPNWQMDRNQMVDRLQPSPVRSAEPLEEVRLIPLGAARLRIGMFPVIGDGPDAHDWVAPVKATCAGVPFPVRSWYNAGNVGPENSRPLSFPPNSSPRVACRRPAADVSWIAADPLDLVP